MSLAHTQALDSPETNAAECSRLLRDYNALITCPLCRGYLIEATTVTECLHAFCRSCILQYVEHNAACPVCQVPLQSARPHTQLRRDHTLQTIVYKLVPDLSKKELQRRLGFYAKQGNCAVGVAQAAKELHLEGFFSPTDSISFSMEFVPFPFEKEPWKPGVVTQETNEFHHGIRYFKCPAAVTIRLLEKLLRRKYQVGDNYNVDFFYGRAKLCPEYRLSDVAYIFAWKQMEPLRLRYHFSPVSTELTNALPPAPPPNLPVLPATVALPPVKAETSETSKPFVQKRKVSACPVSDFGLPEVKKELPPGRVPGDSTNHQCGKHSPHASPEISGGNKRKRRKKSRKKQIGVRRKSHGKHIIEAQARSRVVPDVHLKDEPKFSASPTREGDTSSVTPVTQPPRPENLRKSSVEAMETTSSPEKDLNPKPKSSRPVPGLISLNQEPLTFNFELSDSPPNAKRRKTTPQQTTGSQSSAKSSRASGLCTGLQPDKASVAKKPKISPSHRKPRKRVLKNGTRDDSVVVRKKKENENTPKKTSTDDSSLSYLSLSPNDTVTKEDFTKLLDLKPVQRPPLVSPTTDAPVPAPSSSATLVTTSLNAQNFSVCPVMSSVSLDRMNKSFVIQNSPVECPTSTSFPASVTHPAHFLNNQVTITAVPKKLLPKPLRTTPSKNTSSRRSNPASYTRPPLPKPTASPATTSGRSNPFNFIKMSDYSRAAALFASSVANKNASTVLAGTDGVGVRFPHRGEPSSTRSGICPKTLIDAALGLSQIHVNLRPPPGPLPALKPLTRYLPTPDPNALAKPPPAAHPVATATKTRMTGDQEGSDVDLLIIDESSSTVSSETGALDLSHPRSPPSTVAAPSLARELVSSAKSTASPVPGSKAPSPMKAPPSHNSTKPVLPSTTAAKDAPKTVASAWAATAAQYGNLDLLQSWFSRFGLPVSAGGLKSLPLRPNTSKPDEQGTTENSSNVAGLSKKFVPCLATKMDPKKNAVIKIPAAPNRTKVAGTPETS